MPLSHSAFADLSILDLLTGFWEDHYLRHPTEAKRVGDGREVRFSTGDPLIDKWEEEIASGIPPDLTEGLSPAERDKILAARDRLVVQHKEVKQADVEVGEGFSDSYGG